MQIEWHLLCSGDGMIFKKKKETDLLDEKSRMRLENETLSGSMDMNTALFKKIFSNDDTFMTRNFENKDNNQIKCCIFYIDGMVNAEIINENIIMPITRAVSVSHDSGLIDTLKNEIVVSDNVEKSSQVHKLAKAVIDGDSVLFAEGFAEALVIKTRGWQTRAITEPEGERIIRGPREGFIEPILVNLSLIRRRLATPDLKFKYMQIGVRTQTHICICYIEGIANKDILGELMRRLKSIDVDGILDSGYIQELVNDSPYSPFKTMGSTERPDVVAGKLLEGRIAVVVDGTPVVLTLPHLFIEDLQANEDYYINFYFSSMSRILRILGFIITVSVPAIYVAMMTFHQEMIPTPLLLSISAARQGVPFPTIVETTLLLFVFEILRETGTRMPTNIGQALSIVGALVLGQASVEARIVSAPVVIVVALSGITGLMIPRIKGAAIILRVGFLLLSAFLGLYGLIFAVTGVILHLCQIRSFGVPYLLNLTSLDAEDIKDTIIRAPLWQMRYRPQFIAAGNRKRQADGGKKS